MEKLKVPLAADDAGRIVSPEEAAKDRNFYCPACAALLILRKGNLKTPHFAHKNGGSCAGETVLHVTAKKLIKQTNFGLERGQM